MATVRGRMSSRTPSVEEIVPDSAWSEDSIAHYLIIDLPGFNKEEVKLQVDSSGNIVTRGEKRVSREKHVRFLLTFPEPTNSDMNNISGKFDSEILYVTIPKRNVQEDKDANGNVGIEEENKEEEKQNTDRERRDQTEQEETRNEYADSERRDQTQHGYSSEKEGTRDDNADNGGRDDLTQHGYHRMKEERRNGSGYYMGGFSEELVRKWEQEPNILRSAVKVLRKNKGIVVTAVLAFSLGLLVSRKFQSSTEP